MWRRKKHSKILERWGAWGDLGEEVVDGGEEKEAEEVGEEAWGEAWEGARGEARGEIKILGDVVELEVARVVWEKGVVV